MKEALIGCLLGDGMEHLNYTCL